MPLRVLALALILLTIGAVPEAAARWTEIRTPNFLFIGDAREGDIQRLAETLEGFRDALMQALPGANTRSPVPTVVIVFGSDRSYAPYKPRFEGRVVDAAGYFLSDEDVNYIVIDATDEAHAFRVVFHEYSHFLTENGAGFVPLWVSEGLAQFYETFELRDRGRRAAIGVPIAEHVGFLQRNQPMALAELMAVDERSPVYHEGDRRGLFYAQSWALVHYFTLGSRERAPQFRDYLARVITGTSSDRAFADAFGVPVAVIERELRDYLRQFRFPAVLLTLDPGAGTAVPRGVEMRDADAEAFLGDLLARQHRGSEARGLLARVLDREPGHARAMTALAQIDVREGHVEDGILRLQQAAELAPGDGVVHAALGRAWIEQVRHESARARQLGALREARTALSRASALDPDVVHTRALLGYAEGAVGDDLPKAIELLDDAVRRAPARESYRLMLADVLMGHGEYDLATAHLGLLLAGGSRETIREDARQMLGQVSSLRAADEARAARQAAIAAAEASAARPMSPAAGGTAPAVSGQDLRDPGERRPVPVLRPLGDGETRVLGTFEQIECGAGGQLVLHVATGTGVLRLRAARLGDVELIAYIADPPTSVTCGPVPDAPRVLATFRVDADHEWDGTAVALELIPADFEPR
jgi:tetratricopeptide (TPR) repeat protein